MITARRTLKVLCACVSVLKYVLFIIRPVPVRLVFREFECDREEAALALI